MIKAVIKTIRGESTNGTPETGVLIAEGNYLQTINSISNHPFTVNTSIENSLNQTISNLLDAVVSDADSKGLSITTSEILYPEVKRG